jgi:hypothetical protein
MLDLLGSGYAIDHCIAAFNAKQDELNFRIYMSDAAAALVNMFSSGGKLPRYWELLHPEKKDNRTGEEIAMDIITRHGLKVVS